MRQPARNMLYLTTMETAPPIPRAVLVGIQTPEIDDVAHEASLEELARLVKTLGYEVAGQVSQRRDGTGAGSLLGSGKLAELAALTGGTGHDEVIGEYLGEAAIAPIVMIRRGPWKFIHCPADPDQLFHLPTDPDELANLAASAEHAATVADFRNEVAARWDLDRLRADVLASQARRRIIAAATAKGALTSWDYDPVRDASQEYVRGHMDLEDIEATARFPRVRAE